MSLKTPELILATLIFSAPCLSAQSTIPGVTPLPGTGCALEAAWPIEVTGSASIGGSLTLDPSMPVFTEAVIVGFERVDLPLEAGFGCPCTLVPELALVELGFNLKVELTIPQHPSLIGVRAWAQPYYFDGLPYFSCSLGEGQGTFALGDAVELTVLP